MTTADAEPQTRNWVPDASAFGARLALIRQRMGWGNVKEAAEACRLPVESWRNWERDNREPRNYVEVCRTIASTTGVDLMWLLTGELPPAGGPVVHTSGGRSGMGRAATSTYMLRPRGPRTRLCRPDRVSVAAR